MTGSSHSTDTPSMHALGHGRSVLRLPVTGDCLILDEAHCRDLDAFAIGKPHKPRRQRKPSLKTVLDQAQKAGAASVTTPDGVTITFGQAAEQQTPNPWDEVLPNAPKWPS